MKVILSERVQTALSTLAQDDRQKVDSWLGYLRNWEDDPFAKSNSVRLEVQGKTVYMFRTSTDVRIFFTVDPQDNAVNVVDVTTKDTILSSGGAAAGRS
jgi:mRNA-degrading endonuclease RelE of RelBE toxin-antitoxin system